MHTRAPEFNAHRTVSCSLLRSIIMLNRSSSPLQGGAGDPAGRPDSESIVVGTLDFLQALLLGDATTYQGARELVAAILRVRVLRALAPAETKSPYVSSRGCIWKRAS
jgi:hypothetical protein